MSASGTTASIDMIRWTFTINPAHRAAIEARLTDFGGEVFVRGDDQFHVLWEEPEVNLDDVIAELWELNGSHFEITQEEFHRLSCLLVEHDGDTAEYAAA